VIRTRRDRDLLRGRGHASNVLETTTILAARQAGRALPLAVFLAHAAWAAPCKNVQNTPGEVVHAHEGASAKREIDRGFHPSLVSAARLRIILDC